MHLTVIAIFLHVLVYLEQSHFSYHTLACNAGSQVLHPTSWPPARVSTSSSPILVHPHLILGHLGPILAHVWHIHACK